MSQSESSEPESEDDPNDGDYIDQSEPEDKIVQTTAPLRCKECKKEFTERGNLLRHIAMSHGAKKNGICTVCKVSVGSNYQLKYHIRLHHFNLRAKAPFHEKKKVNQIWFEKVMHSEAVMEMKKTGENVLVMRKLGPNTAIKVQDYEAPDIDLTKLYPVRIKNSNTPKKSKLMRKMHKFLKKRK